MSSKMPNLAAGRLGSSRAADASDEAAKRPSTYGAGRMGIVREDVPDEPPDATPPKAAPSARPVSPATMVLDYPPGPPSPADDLESIPPDHPLASAGGGGRWWKCSSPTASSATSPKFPHPSAPASSASTTLSSHGTTKAAADSRSLRPADASIAQRETAWRPRMLLRRTGLMQPPSHSPRLTRRWKTGRNVLLRLRCAWAGTELYIVGVCRGRQGQLLGGDARHRCVPACAVPDGWVRRGLRPAMCLRRRRTRAGVCRRGEHVTPPVTR